MSSDSQVLRTGVLFKKGSGAGPFGRRNWKPRYFVLTPSRLQYFTFEDGELKGEVSLQGCDEGVIEVMPADSMKTGSSASTIWRISIHAPERRLLVAAGTEMEMNDWVDKLVMAFRINSGQPLQRASLPASCSSPRIMSGGTSAICDFQNFSVPRRGITQRHSTGTNGRPSMGEQQLLVAQAASLKQKLMENTRHLDDQYEQEHAMQRQHEQALQQEQEVQRRNDETQRQLAVSKERKEVALATADELQQLIEQQIQVQVQQVQGQQKTEEQQSHEWPPARAFEEESRVQREEVMRTKLLAEEVAMPQTRQSDDVLELQRRQKREEHARERAERKKAMQQQQQQEQQDLAFRMSLQVNSHLIENDDDDSGVASDRTCCVDPVSVPSVKDYRQSKDDRVQVSAATVPRSSLVGDVKREMIQNQMQEHQRRRAAVLQQEHQTRQQESARVQLEAHVAPRNVQGAPREIEVVRRAPVHKPVVPPLESFDF